LFVTVVLFASIFASIPFSSSADGEETKELAQPDDIRVSPSDNNLSLKAGDTVKVHLSISNEFERALVVFVNYDNRQDPDIHVGFPNGHMIEIKEGGIGHCELDISVDKYARSTDHALHFNIRINDPSRGSTIEAEASHSLMITVSSELSAGKQYNKIMGTIDNHLPAPLNTPLVTTIITMLIWILIAVVVAYFILPVAMGIGKRAMSDTEKIMKRWKK
jgi:hypothetical protein